MINHIGKYNDAQAIQDALDAGTLANPYVAMTSAGTIDYNTLEPTPPAPSTMGYWEHDVETGYYTFKVLEMDQTYWELRGNDFIGYLLNVSYEGNVEDAWIHFTKNSIGNWEIMLEQHSASYSPSNSFVDGTPDSWATGFATGEGSDDEIHISWDGVDTFTFYVSQNAQTPLSIDTYDPPYPEVSGE